MKKLLAVLALASVTMGSMAQDAATLLRSIALQQILSGAIGLFRQTLQVLHSGATRKRAMVSLRAHSRVSETISVSLLL